MRSNFKFWSTVAIVLWTMALAAVATAQTQDFPTYKGSNLRQGNNGSPQTDNPSGNQLVWFQPNGLGYSATMEDNASIYASQTGLWLAPILGQTNGNMFIESDPTQVGIGYNALTPYYYSPVVPSLPNGNVLASTNVNFSTFSWTFGQLQLGNTANDYALYVDIPSGPVVDALGDYYYQPRYYVFKITYGTGLTFVDIVDTQASGYSTNVRLGNGGNATNALFHYDGTDPITITLVNTVPRNSAGVLQGVNTDGAGNILNSPSVFANMAEAVPNLGSIVSSPIVATDTLNTRVFSATDTNVVTQENGTTATQTRGVLSAFDYGTGKLDWTYSAADQGSIGVTMALASAGVSQTPGWTSGLATPLTGFGGFVGTNYLYESVTNTVANEDVATFAPPALADGTYDVKIWCPGPTNPAVPGYPVFAQNVQVEVDQGVNASFYTIDLTQTNGYVSISPGNRFVSAKAAPLVVKISNYSAAAGDAGKLAYANAVRFVGAENLAITSTPVFAKVPIAYTYYDSVAGKNVTTTATKSVVVMCAEDGHIYCLDSIGRGDGTTDIYWAYPSLPDPLNASWTDPNNNSPIGTVPTAPDGSNGQTLAQMPSGFSLSSPLIQEVPKGSGSYFLFVAANNGRIYCLDMKGRGDNYLTNRTPGTTTRIWTYPNDYRPDSPTTPSVPSALGATNASILFNNNAVDGPTIFVPSAQGRIYALAANGNPAQTTTTLTWAYPALTSPTVGPFNATPAIDGPAGAETLFAGSEMKTGSSQGVFYALNVETGAVNWTFPPNPATATGFENFDSAPATAFNGLADGVAGSQYVFVANANGYVYALDNTNNGAVIWQTNELGAGVTAPLMFTYMLEYGTNSQPTATPVPVVEVPDDAGRFNALFAAGNGTTYPTVNVYGGKYADGYQAAGDQITAGTASGHTYMYGADDFGYLYAFGNYNGGIGGGIGGPGGSIEGPNDPDYQDFSQAKIGFLIQPTYTALRYPTAGLPDYTTYTSAANFVNRVPPAFDFGETLYVIVYNFPYQDTTNNSSNNPVTRMANVTFTFSAQGRTVRGSLIAAQEFSGAAPTYNGQTLNGYAVYAFPIQPNGAQMLAPGAGSVSAQIQTTNVNTGANVYMFGNPGTSTINFTIANPLALALLEDPNNPGYGLAMDSLGATAASFPNPASPENSMNGSQAVAGLAWPPGLTASTFGLAEHGQASPTRTIYVADRSLMELLTGPDNYTSSGATNGIAGSIGVRFDRSNAAWQGGYGSVIKPLGGPNGLYKGAVPFLEGMEDYPVQYPNVSLDYPDILSEYINVTSFPNTIAGNPTFSPVTLPYPSGILDATGKPIGNGTGANRTPNWMQVDLGTNVPLYQPANINAGADPFLAGTNDYTGYSSPMDVFVDPNGSGKLNLSGNQASAYRSFTYTLGVDVDEHISVLTPNVDLGSLPEGAGLVPSAGVALGTVRTPWADLLASPHLYQSFQAVNDGNTNLLNVRLAKSTNVVGGGPGSYVGWPFYASENDDLGWLDGSLYMWSDLDAYQTGGGAIGFSPSLGVLPRGEVVTQKPRTTATSGTRIVSNPVTIPNGNLGTTGGAVLNPAFPANQDPHIGITPPIGFPVGSYSQVVRLIEDRSYGDYTGGNNGNSNDYDLSELLTNGVVQGEPFSDPTLNLSFTVREEKLTNSPSPFSSTMVDNLLPGGATNSLDSNIEPTGMRDRTYGNLFVAWASNRTAINNGALLNGDYAYRIYGASLDGSQPLNVGSRLNELAAFKAPNVNQWFSAAGPYPFGASVASVAAVNSAFGVGGGDHVVGTVAGEEDTVRFGQPSLPAGGLENPFVVGDAVGTSDFGHAIMAFVGSATVQTAAGDRVNQNRLFAATVQPVNNGPAVFGAPASSPNEPDLPKSKPSVVQVGTDTAVIFYSAGAGGRSHLYYTLFNDLGGAFSPTAEIDTGPGFDTVSDPAAEGRVYQGLDAADVAQNGNMIELSFSGRLRGRPNNEIFMGRIPTDANGQPNASNSNKELLSYFGQRTAELLAAEANGVFRAVGVDWNPNPATIDILLSSGSNAPASIVTPATPRVFDPHSGILTVNTALGLVYVDTFQGTLRFASTVPGSNYHVYASYQPKFLRLSVSTTAALTGPALLWDDRHVGSTNYNLGTFQMYDRYWYVNGIHAALTNPALLNNRYFVMYNRAAAGTGQSARPMMETLRLGIQLPPASASSTGTAIPTLPSGDIDFTRFQIAGTANPYEVDPTTGRVYFTALDEDNPNIVVTINGITLPPYRVGLIPELSETPIRIDQPVNEGHVAAFVDPFDSLGANTRRPDLVWLFWTSTRTGTSDVYFETIAPLLWPVLK